MQTLSDFLFYLADAAKDQDHGEFFGATPSGVIVECRVDGQGRAHYKCNGKTGGPAIAEVLRTDQTFS